MRIGSIEQIVILPPNGHSIFSILKTVASAIITALSHNIITFLFIKYTP